MRQVFAALSCHHSSAVCRRSASAQSARRRLRPAVDQLTGVYQPADGQPPAASKPSRCDLRRATGGAPLWQETQRSPSMTAAATRSCSARRTPTASRRGLRRRARSGSAPLRSPRRSRRPARAAHQRALRAARRRCRYARRAARLRLSLVATGDDRRSAATRRPPAVTRRRRRRPRGVQPGTVNFLAKYVDAADVGNSAVFEAGGLVGIGTTTPVDYAARPLHQHERRRLTGYAVQNLGNTATSYSGMLFYDQNGALGQFQGFNNVTHEYRINNIARVAPGGASTARSTS